MTLPLRVERQTLPPGPRGFVASADHRVKLHAGPPSRGTCRLRPFVSRCGEIDLVPADWSDEWEEHDETRSLLVHVPTALLRQAAQQIGLPAGRAAMAPRHQFRDARIEHIVWALDADVRAGAPGGRLFAESLGLALATHLLGAHAAPVARAPASLSQQRLSRLLAHIEAHLDEDLSLERLAGVAGLSASHLKTVFKRSTGLPVHQFVVQRRVERAVALLRRGDLPAAHVAQAAGFAHQSHMARCMRRWRGLTPTAVRG